MEFESDHTYVDQSFFLASWVWVWDRIYIDRSFSCQFKFEFGIKLISMVHSFVNWVWVWYCTYIDQFVFVNWVWDWDNTYINWSFPCYFSFWDRTYINSVILVSIWVLGPHLYQSVIFSLVWVWVWDHTYIDWSFSYQFEFEFGTAPTSINHLPVSWAKLWTTPISIGHCLVNWIWVLGLHLYRSASFTLI